MRLTTSVLIAITLVACNKPTQSTTVKELKTDDTTPNFVIKKAEGATKGIVLLFHQAGSNLHEYDSIAPKFNKLGYDTMAVDQRSGGNMWNAENVTAKKYPTDPGYSAAYADMVAGLRIAEGKDYKSIIVVGSSYSASLSLRLASENSTVSAVLAFSPGEYFEVEGQVAKWNSMVTVPTLFAGTKEEVTSEMYKIYESKPRVEGRSGDILAYFPGGVHGASALRSDKNPESSKDYWKMVENFLTTHFPD